MTWKKGFSWTKGYWARNGLYVCSGLFLWIPNFLGIEFYCGARPTPPWREGIGNEGLDAPFARWRKRHGFGNIGIALRRSSW